MIIAVIVLFNPVEELLLELLKSIRAQCDQVVLVDNSPGQGSWSLANDTDILYIHKPENVGIAEAHNIGLRQSMQMGAKFALLLDQDSTIPSNLIDGLLKSFTDAKVGLSKVAAVGPSIICEYSDERVEPRIQKTLTETETYKVVPQIISSGMLINISCLTEVGMKESSLFIDAVDHEWCWRAQHYGYNIALSKVVKMRHRLGSARKSMFGVAYRVGMPIRLYFQFRNILLLVRRSYVPFYWKFRNLMFMPLKFIVNALFESCRQERIKYMYRGIIDGIAGRSGPFRD